MTSSPDAAFRRRFRAGPGIGYEREAIARLQGLSIQQERHIVVDPSRSSVGSFER